MPKSKSKARARAAPRFPMSPGFREVLAFYQGGNKPFRLADQYRSPTATVTLVSDDTLQLNTAGSGAIGFLPNLNYATLNNTVTSNNLGASWTQTAHPQVSTLTTAAYKARCLALRVTVRYVGAESATSGAMFVGTGSAWNANMVSAGMSNFTPAMTEYALQAGKTWTFYAPVLGQPDFETLAGNAYFGNYLAGIVFLVTGGPASGSVLSFRTERVIEYQPEPTGSVLVESAVEPFDPIQVETVGALNSTANNAGPSYAERVANAVYTYVLRPLGNAAYNEAREYLTGSGQRIRALEL